MLSHRVEVRLGAIIVDEHELKAHLGTAQLPKHMRSVPTLQLPKVPHTIQDMNVTGSCSNNTML